MTTQPRYLTEEEKAGFAEFFNVAQVDITTAAIAYIKYKGLVNDGKDVSDPGIGQAISFTPKQMILHKQKLPYS